MEYKENYNKKVESQLRLIKMYIKSATFNRKPLCNKNLNINISHNIAEEQNNKYVIDLTVDVSNDDSSLNISIVMSGEFISDNRDLIEQNAIAIMFPYIRSYLSILTTQPDLTPIVLQPVNVISLLSNN